MKLTGELKDKVEVAETMGAKKNIIAEAGMELTDDELESVVGGSYGDSIREQYEELLAKKTLAEMVGDERELKTIEEKMKQFELWYGPVR